MLKPLLITLLISNSLPSQATSVQWTLIAKTKQGDAFADIEHVTTENGLKIVNTRFNEKHTTKLESSEDTYKSFDSVIAIDCKKNASAMKSIKFFSEKDALGKLVVEHEDNELLYTEFRKIRPKHPLAKLRDLVCKK